MDLSITQRLTATFAFLTAAILLPASIALHRLMVSRLEKDASRSLISQAAAVAERIRYQWDEDLLVEFSPFIKPLEGLRVGAPHWALGSSRGKPILTGGPIVEFPLNGPFRKSRCVDVGGRPYRLASVPLVGSRTLHLEDLPQPVHAALRTPGGDFAFLCAKREATRQGEVFEIKVLKGSVLTECRIAANGEVRSRKDVGLSEQFSAEQILELLPELSVDAVQGVTYKAYDRQLIAVLNVQTYRGLESIAVNRLGERFRLDDRGEVLGIAEEHRLYLTLATEADDEIAAREGILASLGFGAPLLWFALSMVGWFVSRRAMLPVQSIVNSLRSIKSEDLSRRLPVPPRGDELSRIADAINSLLERVEGGYLRERQFTGDASHELRTPLAKFIAEIDLALLSPRGNAEYEATLARCRKYADGMRRLLESLLLLARLDNTHYCLSSDVFDVFEWIEEVIRGFSAEAMGRIQLERTSRATHPLVYGDRALLSVLLRNLLDNALRYSPVEKSALVRVEPRGTKVRIEIQDEGTGISAADIHRVFDRFVRLETSRSRETGGSGLGLSIVRAIAKAHDFEVSLSSTLKGQTSAVFELQTNPWSGPGI